MHRPCGVCGRRRLVRSLGWCLRRSYWCSLASVTAYDPISWSACKDPLSASALAHRSSRAFWRRLRGFQVFQFSARCPCPGEISVRRGDRFPRSKSQHFQPVRPSDKPARCVQGRAARRECGLKTEKPEIDNDVPARCRLTATCPPSGSRHLGAGVCPSRWAGLTGEALAAFEVVGLPNASIHRWRIDYQTATTL